ncbi:MAG TPA: hypothetical protein VHS31_03985 [Tepidisphaeraceae bacterium]|jgi:hypothetical protein|nr:hypothetical protein [Tepidisphaeraceae bacterium]
MTHFTHPICGCRLFFAPFAIAFAFAAIAITIIPPRTLADTYNVNQAFTDGSTHATLVGTVDIPEGNYTITNRGASPFTGANLTLTINPGHFAVDNILTNSINGTGQFIIHATPTQLTFDVATSDNNNPADLIFSDSTTTSPPGNEFITGADAIPGFRAAETNDGGLIVPTTFPITFGTAVPEPASGAMVFLTLASLYSRRPRRD